MALCLAGYTEQSSSLLFNLEWDHDLAQHHLQSVAGALPGCNLSHRLPEVPVPAAQPQHSQAQAINEAYQLKASTKHAPIASPFSPCTMASTPSSLQRCSAKRNSCSQGTMQDVSSSAAALSCSQRAAEDATGPTAGSSTHARVLLHMTVAAMQAENAAQGSKALHTPKCLRMCCSRAQRVQATWQRAGWLAAQPAYLVTNHEALVFVGKEKLKGVDTFLDQLGHVSADLHGAHQDAEQNILNCVGRKNFGADEHVQLPAQAVRSSTPC